MMSLTQTKTAGRIAGLDLGRSYSSLFFLDSPGLGLVLMLGTWCHANIALCGLLGWLTAYILVRLIGPRIRGLREGAILYNALLVGLFTGYLFELEWVVLPLLLGSIALTAMFTLLLEAFLTAQGLPVLSLPFTIIAAMLSLSSSRLTNLIDATPYYHEVLLPFQELLPHVVGTFCHALGAVLCLPDQTFGAFVWLLIATRSPLIASALVAGFGIGYAAESLLQINGADPSASHYFNYALSFAAIAAVFLSPSRISLALASLAALGACLLAFGCAAFWSPLRVPMTALPFNLMILLLMRSIYSVKPWLAASQYAGDPEETIERARLYNLRHRGGEIGIFCPFEGKWQVQQGFDGPWTHKGLWRHALDFVATGDDGKTFTNQGLELSDYHAFGRAVVSPVDGYVVAVCNEVDDNPIGRVENQKNWGNYVIIRSVFGFFVVLAHLKKGSIGVATGAFVAAEQKLAACGNSGYSQEPHLHVQVQYAAVIGAYTTPFHLVNFRTDEQISFHAVPAVGTQLEPLALNKAIDRLLTFTVGQSLTFVCSHRGKSSEVTITVCLDETTGALHLSDGRARLGFSRTGAQFYFYGFEGQPTSILAHLMLAAPRLPITYRDHAQFVDHLPLRLTNGRVGRWGRLWLALAAKHSAIKAVSYRFDPVQLELRGEAEIHGRATPTFLRFDPIQGFQQITVGDFQYERKAA